MAHCTAHLLSWAHVLACLSTLAWSANGTALAPSAKLLCVGASSSAKSSAHSDGMASFSVMSPIGLGCHPASLCIHRYAYLVGQAWAPGCGETAPIRSRHWAAQHWPSQPAALCTSVSCSLWTCTASGGQERCIAGGRTSIWYAATGLEGV